MPNLRVDREYFTYGVTPTSGLSRVESIAECDGISACLPPVTLTWNDVSIDYEASSDTLPEPTRTANGNSRGQFADINGDGRTDWITSYIEDGITTATTWLNTQDGWQQSADYTPPAPLMQRVLSAQTGITAQKCITIIWLNRP